MLLGEGRPAEAVPIPTRSEILAHQRSEGRRIAAVLPVHYSRALLRGHGYQPMEVWGPPHIDASLAAAHLQPYVCSVVRNALAFLLSGGLADADLVLVPHGCDSLQGLASLLLDFVSTEQPVLPLYIPRGTGRAARTFLAQELRALSQRLAEISGISPSKTDLMGCIELEERADDFLCELVAARPRLPFDDMQFYRLVRAREYLPAERFAAIARSALSLRGGIRQDRIPIAISGLLPEPSDLLSRIWELGGTIVADDLACVGRRRYRSGRSADPFTRMAERLLSAPPDSTRGAPVEHRLSLLRDLTARDGARGVIFYNVKFCEPEAFYHPLLREGLAQAGIPSLVIEADISEPLSDQVCTRLEAFIEMLT
jgi:benzoyl-CoA reductase/2-hydroxyglutaryl-CoA dehydratase subunit BcrC/BadD/HgdB